MLQGLLEVNSLLLDLEPPLIERVGIDAAEFEEQVAEVAADGYSANSATTLRYFDASRIAMNVAEQLGVAWHSFDLEVQRLLLAGTLEILRQVIPSYRREF